jgi:hypothetical protein
VHRAAVSARPAERVRHPAIDRKASLVYAIVIRLVAVPRWVVAHAVCTDRRTLGHVNDRSFLRPRYTARNREFTVPWT